MNKDDEPLLDVRDLQVSFKTDDSQVRAVRGVSFEVYPGETVGLVGESGSGKSVTNLALMGLVPRPPGKIDGGEVWYRGRDLLKAGTTEMQSIRGRRIAMIFQDPMTALNPLMTVGQQLTEMTRLHLGMNQKDANRHAADMLEMVGISGASRRLRDYPHQFSGGMRQRVMIAMALSCEPDLLIADEPTTALDVTIQAQILDLLRDLQERRGTSIIMITHDLGVVAEICHRVLVMYAGKVVEKADVNSLFAAPEHPYTQGLLRSLPRLDQASTQLEAIPGQPPDLGNLSRGCSFRPRCPDAIDRCAESEPALTSIGQERKAACYVAQEAADV
ncbi:ABC transporter ATP-binding protein [Roseiconus lacunae]|uniref:ABC transporter ATP-binding protein n=1 Tax=Roseiconus lacunae TaxID=2605694 RepID=A0ABT7PG11_9BACT|nr:ABC transporter ATP-binding protein [Roseiconus lacunae]MCD0460521.1 ABC transporter ATP-binding protein [Roseiconus lacunae]MDM4015432.1 ABC transporter ATP-binding protein [Roseiconus lacunae]WRQ52889.1 ABC transporter ATP-binding protein [Stieleria sp. HD01]